MHIVRIILSAEKSLQQERLEIADLVENLNHSLENRGSNILLKIWDGETADTESFKDKVSESDLFLTLYYNAFNDSTQKELDTAYQLLCKGGNPKKIYVYFKEADNVSEELKEFRDSFPTNYGHFYCSYINVDSLKADFLLQFIEYQGHSLNAPKIIEVRDGKISIEGKEYVDLKNVPFAGNNEEYNLLQKSIRKTQKLLAVTDEDDPEYQEMVAELDDLKERRTMMEKSLWDTALMITHLSTTRCSERLKRAMELFSAGDNRGAKAILNEEEIDRDVEHNLRLIQLGEEGKNGLKLNIDEYRLRIKTLQNEMLDDWCDSVCALYEKSLELGRKVLDKTDLAELLSDYGDFLIWQGFYEDVESIYLESISICKELESIKPGSYDHIILWNVYELSQLYINSSQFSKAEEILTYGLSVSKDDDNSLVTSTEVKLRLAYLHVIQNKKELAESEYKLAIDLLVGSNNANDKRTLVDAYYYLGQLYRQTDKLTEAEEVLMKAMALLSSDQSMKQDNDILNGLYELLGNVYDRQKRTSEAEAQFLKQKEIVDELSINNPNPYAISKSCVLANLARIHRLQNRYNLAMDELKEALSINARLFKKYPVNYAEYYSRTLYDLAFMYKDLKQYSEAESILIRSIEAYDVLESTDAEQYLYHKASSQNLLGIVYYEQKKYTLAKEQYLRSKQLWEELCNKFGGYSKANIASSLTNLGLLDCDTGNYIESEKEFLEAIEIFSDDSIRNRFQFDISLLYLNLGYLFQKQSNWEIAENYNDIALSSFKACTDAYEKNLLKRHTAKVLYNQSTVCLKSHKYDKATESVKESISLTEELASCNAEVYETLLANRYNRYAWLLYLERKYDIAEPYARQAVDIFRNRKQKAEIRMALDTLACILRERKEYDSSLQMFEECIKLCQDLRTTEENKSFHEGKLGHEYLEMYKLHIMLNNYEAAGKMASLAKEHFCSLDEKQKEDFADDYAMLDSIKQE